MLFHNEKHHISKSIGDNYLLADQELHQELPHSQGFWLNRTKFYSSFLKVESQIHSGKEKKKKTKNKDVTTTNFFFNLTFPLNFAWR